jgi:hypothetical protein
MIYIWLNLLPILTATALGLAIGAAYRTLLGPHARLSGGTLTIIAFGEFWLAAILAGALILAPDKASPWVMAVGSAIVIWAGFVLPSILVTQRYRATPWSAVLGDCGYWLVTMVVQAVAMKLIGLVPPPIG